MSKFPKRYCLPDGSIYVVTLENVRSDWAYTVKQFDDLSASDIQKQIDDFDEEHAEQWMGDQWYGAEVVTWGADTGEIDEGVREAAMQRLKRSMDDEFARALEVKP